MARPQKYDAKLPWVDVPEHASYDLAHEERLATGEAKRMVHSPETAASGRYTVPEEKLLDK